MYDTKRNFELHVMGSELAGMFLARVEFHAKRAEQHKINLKKIQDITPKEAEVDEDMDIAAIYANTNSGKSNLVSAAHQAKAKIQEHIQAADKFRFMANHVKKNVEYALTMQDVQDLKLLEPVS